MNDPYHRNPTAPLPSFVLLTDAPPLKNGGHGCHILAWNWIEANFNPKLLRSVVYANRFVKWK